MSDLTRVVDHLAFNHARLSGEGDTDLAIRLLKERDEARKVAAMGWRYAKSHIDPCLAMHMEEEHEWLGPAERDHYAAWDAKIAYDAQLKDKA